MKIGIVGSGNIGGTLARLWSGAGHEVMVSNSRGPESLRDFVAEIGARAGTVDEAARFGEVVLLATPWRSPEALPSPDAVTGKIVIDAMNPYTAAGGIHDLGDSSSSEETAKRLPGAKLVKAFNTIWVRHLEANGRPDAAVDERHAVFVAGDDAEAKAVVFQLIEDIGFGPVDTGSLRDGKRQEPNTNLYNQVITAGEGKQRVAG
jgi:8-hydroxy-5-deazaflavin:NADPH oxidoreductase